jgi:hypothetical protein
LVPVAVTETEEACPRTTDEPAVCVITAGWQIVTTAAPLSTDRLQDPVTRTQYVVVVGGVTSRLAPVPPATGLAVLPLAPAYHW